MPKAEDLFLKQLKERFINDLLECFEEVFYELAGESMEMAIAKDVYAKYRPSRSPRGYKRRKYDGGLIAHENFNIQIYREGDKVIGYVRNMAHGVGKAYMLDEVIVEGDMYDWTTSAIYKMQPFPRDFYKGTIERIETSRWQYHVRRLMNQRGWKTRGK